MFYAHFVLAKKGPLARIWLAAHWDKKLTKAHVFETNIESSVEGILQPKVKMALRTSGHLLLGIVRIYSRKAKYLLADCNEAFIKIKIAFRPGVVDLPEGNREAAVSAITLPEVFHDFDTALPDISIDMDAQVSLNQSRAEDITLKEDYGNLSLMADDGFDDMGFDEPDGGRDPVEDSFEPSSLLLCGEQPASDAARASEQPSVSGAASRSSSAKHKVSLDGTPKDDAFEGNVGEALLDGDTGGLFEPAGLFDDAPLGPVELDPPAEPTTSGTHTLPQDKPLEQPADEDSDDDIYDMAPGSMGAPSPPSSPESPNPEAPDTVAALPSEPSDPLARELQSSIPSSASMQQQQEEMPPPPVPAAIPDVATLVHNDVESFALAPLDAMISHSAERVVKTKRKRKLVVDEVKSISGEEMKSQLSDTTDIVATLDLAPPTKRLMHWKETGGVEKLFSLPGHRILSKTLTRSYLRHLTTRSVENEIYGEDDQDELEPEIEKTRAEDISESNKRRRLMEPDTGLPQDLSQLDAFPLDATPRPAFPPSEPSLDPFLNMLHTPDLPHIPHVMDVMGSHGPSLNSITPSLIHSEASSLMEQQQHLLAGLDHLPPQEMPPPPPYVPPQNGAQMHMNGADDEATQPLVDASQFMPPPPQQQTPEHQPEPIPEMPQEPVPTPQPILPQQQNGTLPDPQSTAQNMLFDSLIGDLQQHQQHSTSSVAMTPQMPLNDLDAGKINDFGGSDDEAHDYEAPASVGPAYPEEQMADETYEQFEERILTKRTTVLLHSIHTHLDVDQSVSFAGLVANNRRKQVAQKFYTFLVLKKQHAVELHQDSTFSDLIITRGPKYESVLAN